MTTVKRAVTIDAGVESEARQYAGGNFSAFVNEALKRHLAALKVARLADADRAERGTIDSRTLADVERELERLDT